MVKNIVTEWRNLLLRLLYMSHLKLVRLSNHWIVMTISSVECEARYKIKVMAEIMPSSSEYGKNPQETKEKLKRKGLRICDHRDGDNGDDVTLYYPGFQCFIDQCNDTTYECRPKEYTFIEHMCTQMSKYMPKGDNEGDRKKCEAIRQNVFIKLINQYLKNDLIPNNGVIDEVAQNIYADQDITFEPDDAMKKGGGYSLDGYINPCTCVMLEVKNESGKGGGSDSYAQAIAYYVKTLEEKLVGRCPAPAFLLELVGPHLFISGAVYGKCVFVDRLVDPVWLVPHQREEAMIRIARIFKALKDAVTDIREYYSRPNPIGQTSYNQYPTVTLHKVDDERAEIDIKYTKRIHTNMFEGTVEGSDEVEDGTTVIIYFVARSSRERTGMRFIQQHGLIKEIKDIALVKETLYEAIIMEHKDGVTSFSDYLEKCKPQLHQ